MLPRAQSHDHTELRALGVGVPPASPFPPVFLTREGLPPLMAPFTDEEADTVGSQLVKLQHSAKQRAATQRVPHLNFLQRTYGDCWEALGGRGPSGTGAPTSVLCSPAGQAFPGD